MSVKLYDEALANKIQKWIKDPKMVILKPNEVSRLWQVRADQKNDEPLTLPLIAISRESTLNIEITSRRNLSCSGLNIGTGEKKVIQLDAIPITVAYQIDIYTQKYEEGDEYLRNFIFNFVNHPKMKILIPYNGANIEHVCNIHLLNQATDNSDVAEKLFPDQFTRWSLQIELNDAFMFSIPDKEPASIVGAELTLVNKLSDGNKTEIIENVDSISADEVIPETDLTYEEE